MGLLDFNYKDNPLKLGLLMGGLQGMAGGSFADGFGQGAGRVMTGKRRASALDDLLQHGGNPYQRGIGPFDEWERRQPPTDIKTFLGFLGPALRGL